MAVQSSPKKRLSENGGSASNFKRPKPSARRDFPRNCGPSKPSALRDFPRNCGPAKCGPILESSSSNSSEDCGSFATEGFDDVEKLQILDDVAEELASGNEKELVLFEEEWGIALEKVAEFIDLAREFTAVFGGKCFTSGKLIDVNVSAEQKLLMEAVRTGEGVEGRILEEKVSKKGGEDCVDFDLEWVHEEDNSGVGMKREDLEDDVCILSPEKVAWLQSLFENRFCAKALVAKNQAELKFEEVIDFRDDYSDGQVSLSEENGKNYGESCQELESLDSDQVEVEKGQDESMDNFAIDRSLDSFELREIYNDKPKIVLNKEELINMCIGRHDQPEVYKVREALTTFEKHLKALKKQKSERGKEPKGKSYAYTEAAMRVKAEGKCISIQKPFGHIPGIEIGDTFRFRAELAVVGLNHQFVSGIDYVTVGGQKLATCVVDSGRYENEAKPNDLLIYSGQGGNPKVANKAADQKLVKGNLAMRNSMEMDMPIRVIRKWKCGHSSAFHRSNDSKYLYAYDGLYTITKAWQERDENGRLVFKFELVRMSGQPRSYAAVAKVGKSLPCKEVAKVGKFLSRKEVAKVGKFLSCKEVCVIVDISQGQENQPIRAINGIDDLRPPTFKYTNKIIYPDEFKPVELIGCNCIDGCSYSQSCSCVVRNGGEIPYNEKGLILGPRSFVYECGPNCKCPPSCMNRVSQHGPKYQLEIFRTKIGWGLRTRHYVTSGSFICEYVGELLRDKEAEQRFGDDEYLFDIGDVRDEDGESTNIDAFAIDAGKFGNVGRFVNHSCSPNMYAQQVLYDHDDKKVPHIMFFATKNIQPLKELTCDYNYKIDRVCDKDVNIKKKSCFCDSENCKGRLY